MGFFIAGDLIMNFLIENWPRVGVVYAIIITPILFYYKTKLGIPLFLIWLMTPIYLLHQTEEYLIPGGFKKELNKNFTGDEESDGPLTFLSAFIINVPLIWIVFPLFAALATYYDNLNFGVYIFYFSVLNGFTHVGLGIVQGRYNPGLFVSFFGNVLFGLISLTILHGTGKILPVHIILSAIVGILIHLAIILPLRLKTKALNKTRTT
jgi:hypothetical protein